MLRKCLDEINARHYAVSVSSMSWYWQSFSKYFLCTSTLARQAAFCHILWDGWATSRSQVVLFPQPAATSSKVLQRLIPLPSLRGWGDGTLRPQSNQSLSKHTKVLLLLQLETWLDGEEEGILLERTQLHFISIRKFSWASFFSLKWWINTLLFKCLIKLKTHANWMKENFLVWVSSPETGGA